ncbi:tRNA (guanine(10)-N2)-methyltransferase homolog [Ylistrum balloti]|uniref:tRNA (guanine(10)-N2)-methyltransferase homolog n=1 Tax=Ylistrum balloti TaxID=509963 RepID=UPI002905908B|nr:tRNA (guanine(10)-N2)-methyltransferase homolog [Ylistrum balloti]
MAAPMSGSRSLRTYLIQFANQHTDFRIAEFKALIDLFHADIQWQEKDIHVNNPYLLVKMYSEESVRKIGSRSVLIKNIIELWGHGTTYIELNKSLRDTSRNVMAPHFVKEKSFKLELDAFNKKLSHLYKLEKFKNLPDDVLDFQGEVNLKNPDGTFYLLEDYGPYGSQPPDHPHHIYFGRQELCSIDANVKTCDDSLTNWDNPASSILACIREEDTDCESEETDDIESECDKSEVEPVIYILFTANTSMDAGLSLLMANIGKVRKNHLIMDPFVGTGSLLVACAHNGAYVMGTDINYLLLHAKGKPSRAKQKKRESDESIQANLCQYGLGDFYIDAVVGDASKHRMWRQQSMFDAIITDPPYGIREKTKKVGTVEEDVELTEDQKIGHVPQKIDYHLGQIFKDLLNFAAKFLHLGGRLVYWFPIDRRGYKEENIPTHPCLHCVANCEQVLNCRIARRLITMEKVHQFEEIHQSDSAHVEVDHYEEVSFRQMYFHTRKSKGHNSNEQMKIGNLGKQENNLPDKMAASSLAENG